MYQFAMIESCSCIAQRSPFSHSKHVANQGCHLIVPEKGGCRQTVYHVRISLAAVAHTARTHQPGLHSYHRKTTTTGLSHPNTEHRPRQRPLLTARIFTTNLVTIDRGPLAATTCRQNICDSAFQTNDSHDQASPTHLQMLNEGLPVLKSRRVFWPLTCCCAVAVAAAVADKCSAPCH